MIISKIIFFIDLFAWLLPPFRQKGNKYFIYFLLLAVSDPIFFLLNWTYDISSPPYYIIISLLAFISLVKKKLLFLILLLSIGFIIYLQNAELIFLNFVIHFFILVYFLKDLVITTSEKDKIIIFNLILVLYEVSVMTKFAVSFLFSTGRLLYDFATVFDIFIGIFFTIFNDKKSPEIKLPIEAG